MRYRDLHDEGNSMAMHSWLRTTLSLLHTASLAACAVNGPSSSASDPAPAAVQKPPLAAPAAVDRALRRDIGAGIEAHAFTAAVDLDDDGESEYVAYVAGPMVCGTGGCNLYVLDELDGLWRIVGRTSVVRPPIRLGAPDGAPWRPLLVRVGGGGLAAATVALHWRAGAYPSNPSTEAALAAEPADALVLVPDFDSYREGRALPATADTARVLGNGVAEEGIEALREAVLGPLLAAFAGQNRIAATDDEVAAWIARIDRSRAADVAARRARLAEIDARLADAGLPGTERAALAREAADQRQILSLLAAPAAMTAEEREAREAMARAVIVQWKVHRALYARHGGRIGHQQGGPEPLDAVRAFLLERRDAGDFEILDPVLAEAFWDYWNDDQRHDFMPPGGPEASRAFRDPPWSAD
jgi:hypothetical protein